MAIGDAMRIGRWKLTRNSGEIVYANNYTNYIDYTSYKNIEFDFNYTDVDCLEWLEYKIDDKKAYILRSSAINWISLSEAKSFCNKTVEINGIKYSYTLMTTKQWEAIPRTITDVLIWKDYSIEFLTSTTKTVSLLNGTFVQNTTSYAEDNGKYGFLYYLPVLVQINSAPIISGSDEDLGNKTSSFSVTYSVSDEDSGQELTVKEKLNGTVIRTLQNPTQNSTLTFTITDELFASLSMNTTNTIEIEVTDGSATSYRRCTTAPLHLFR